MIEEQLNKRELEFKNLRKSKNNIIFEIVKNSDEYFINGVEGIYDVYGVEGDENILLKIYFDNNDGKDFDICPYQIAYLDNLIKENIKEDNEFFCYSTFLRGGTFYVTLEHYSE